MSDAGDFALPVIDNIIVILGFIGIVLMVSAPAYFIYTFRKKGNISKPLMALIFGMAFFYTWIQNSPL